MSFMVNEMPYGEEMWTRPQSPLIIHAFSEQFKLFSLAFLERLNRGFMLERPLRDAVVIDLDVIAQLRFQFGS